MSHNVAEAKKILSKQLFKALMAEGENAKHSSWFAKNRFAEKAKSRKAA